MSLGNSARFTVGTGSSLSVAGRSRLRAVYATLANHGQCVP